MNRAVRLFPLTLAVLALAPASAHATTTLATGLLTSASGLPSTGEVRIYAFQLPKGDEVAVMPLLGTARAGADGRFAVSAADQRQLVKLAAKHGGQLDLAAVGDTPSSRGLWGFTVYVDSKAGAARASAAAAAPTPDIRIRAGEQLTFAQAARVQQCDTKLRSRKPISMQKWAVVGELNNAYNDGTTATFSYARNNSAETAFGIAHAYEGLGFSISGEKMINNAGKVTFPPARKRYSRKLRSLFEFTKYQTQASSCAKWETEIRATSWLGGHNDTIKQNGLDTCDTSKVATYEPGSQYDRDSGKAVRFNRAVEAWGVNLTSSSGFSSNVTLHYDFKGPPGKKHYLCGENGEQSPFESGRVFSGSKK